MTRAYLLPAIGAGLLACSFVLIPWAGCKQSGVGDPCIPEQEYQQSFAGFGADEVSTESESFQCETRLCFVNHFQGRVSCPYGQTDAGAPPASGADPCYIPHSQPEGTGPLSGTTQATDGILPNDPANGDYVPPQCNTRQAANYVFCSCRCANINGATDDGATYCKCPSGFTCDTGSSGNPNGYVSSIGTTSTVTDQQLTGYYCVQADSHAYDPTTDCLEGNFCDATKNNCSGNGFQAGSGGTF